MILDFQMKNVKYFSFNKARGGREGIKSSWMKRKENMICFKDKHGSSELLDLAVKDLHRERGHKTHIHLEQEVLLFLGFSDLQSHSISTRSNWVHINLFLEGTNFKKAATIIYTF